MKKQEFKVGDLVRILAMARKTNGVQYKQGQVVEVTHVTAYGSNGWANVTMRGVIKGIVIKQGCISDAGLKLAKQAMRRRAEYEARRG